MGRGSTPSDGELTRADLAPSAKAAKDVSPEPPAASPGPKEESKADVPKATPVVKLPEPNAKGETKTALIPDKTAEAKPASKDSPAEKPEPDEKKAPAKKLDPPSADEQKRLIREIDEVYKPGEAKDQAAKTALARKLLEDGRKNEANRAEQFVLLRRAGEIACDAGEADLMLEAVDAIAAAGFDIRSVQVKSRLLKRLVEQGSLGGANQLSTFSASCVKFAEEAAAGGAVDEASDVLDAASEVAWPSRKNRHRQPSVRQGRRWPAHATPPTKRNGRRRPRRRKRNWRRSTPRCRRADRLRQGPPTGPARARGDPSGPGAAQDRARRSGRLPGGRPLVLLLTRAIGTRA